MDGNDKLAVEVGGRPLLAWTLDAVAAATVVDRIIVVAPPERRAAVAAAAWLPAKVIDVVDGGSRRQESVFAGFTAFDRHEPDEAGVVLVHDAARPMIDRAVIEAVVRVSAERGAAVPIVPIVETLKRLDGDRVGETVDRTRFGAAQTPQGARRDLFRKAWTAFRADGPETFTDEAALLEACSIPVHVVAGDPGNRKVTVPSDLRTVAAALLGVGPTRTGIGHDSHPFGPGEPLVLGGIEIAGAPALAGHSDGDVVLHAVADALLGATGLGDLGRLFPADARTPRGIAGASLIEEVRRQIAPTGWRPSTIDLTVVAARPRLGAYLDPMRDRIAALLDLDPGSVNVKASSGNLDGADGGGRSISALVIATVESTG